MGFKFKCEEMITVPGVVIAICNLKIFFQKNYNFSWYFCRYFKEYFNYYGTSDRALIGLGLRRTLQGPGILIINWNTDDTDLKDLLGLLSVIIRLIRVIRVLTF